jgi:hypothetical protein
MERRKDMIDGKKEGHDRWKGEGQERFKRGKPWQSFVKSFAKRLKAK